MVTTAATVDDYMAKLPEQARAVGEAVRSLIHAVVPDVTEAIRYQMPVFLVGGHYLVYLGAWKNHVGLYPVPIMEGGLETRLTPHRSTKDTIRFLYRDPLPADLIGDLVEALLARVGNPATA